MQQAGGGEPGHLAAREGVEVVEGAEQEHAGEKERHAEGTEIAIACSTLPDSTPRRAAALFNAKAAADSSASNPPSMRFPIPSVRPPVEIRPFRPAISRRASPRAGRPVSPSA